MPFIIKRKKTQPVMVGKVKVGDMAPVSVQSMTNTLTQDVPATVSQIQHLEMAGCEIVRMAVPDQEAAEAISSIKEKVSPVPLNPFFREIKYAVMIKRVVSSSPGRTPARNRPVTDVMATTADIISGLLGGIRIPNVPPVEVTPAANCFV